MATIIKWAVIIYNNKDHVTQLVRNDSKEFVWDTKKEAEEYKVLMESRFKNVKYAVACVGWDDGLKPDWQHAVDDIIASMPEDKCGPYRTRPWKVPAVKKVREMEGLGLKEAKDLVNEYTAHL